MASKALVLTLVGSLAAAMPLCFCQESQRLPKSDTRSCGHCPSQSDTGSESRGPFDCTHSNCPCEHALQDRITGDTHGVEPPLSFITISPSNPSMTVPEPEGNITGVTTERSPPKDPGVPLYLLTLHLAL